MVGREGHDLFPQSVTNILTCCEMVSQLFSCMIMPVLIMMYSKHKNYGRLYVSNEQPPSHVAQIRHSEPNLYLLLIFQNFKEHLSETKFYLDIDEQLGVGSWLSAQRRNFNRTKLKNFQSCLIINTYIDFEIMWKKIAKHTFYLFFFL